MRIEWGSRGHTLDLGACGTRRCDACQRDRPCRLTVRYTYQYLLDPALAKVSEEQYLAVCETCGGGTALDAATMKASLGKNPIPWQHRHGFFVGVGAILTVVLFVRLISGAH